MVRCHQTLCLVVAAAPATWVQAMEKLDAPGDEDGILPAYALVRDHASYDHRDTLAFMIQKGVRDKVC